MQIIIDTQGNTIKAHTDGNAQILEAIKALIENNREIVIPAPVVNVPVTVQPAPAPVNNITVKPSDVVIPPAPTEATITTDRNGKKILKVTK